MASSPFTLPPGPANDLFGAPPAPPTPADAFAPLGGGSFDTSLPDEKAIRKLKPGSDAHSAVMSKLMAMLKFSNNRMSGNFSRWRNQELKVQAYLLTQDYKELVETISASKGAEIPEPIKVVVPYTYATLHTAATYMGTILIGRKPLFPLMGTRGTNADVARYMEQVLQSNLDATKGQEKLWQHLWDSLLYGFSAEKISWAQRNGKVMRLVGGQRQFTDELKFAGNVLDTIDPYKFRPDPRVPMHECHRRGDFMFDITETSFTILRDKEDAGEFMWVKEALHKAKGGKIKRHYEDSRRSSIQGGNSPSERDLNPRDVVGFAEVCEGTVRLVPKDWGLGEKNTSELWRFVFLPDNQIIYAAPADAMHEEHPYAVGEPTSLGHDFMSMSQSEMISVFQDLLSWLVSSRMENVRASIQNSYLVDPARVEMNDMASSAIGRVIRLKQSSMGLPVKEALMQLQVNDVTGGHFQDIQTIRLLADAATGVTDNLRGLQNGSGRKSATEARLSMEAGANRLSQLAIRMSGQSFQTIATQMISNIQQWMPDDFWIEVSGDEGMESKRGQVDQLVGSFTFQISDGTLPLDKGALLEQWKEVMMAVAQDPELRAGWDINQIFRHVAILGGVKNIDGFKRQPPPAIAPPGVDPSLTGAPVGGPGAPPMPASLAFAG